MRIDFFVQPDHAFITGYPNEPVLNAYRAHISRVFEKSECPILISGLERGEIDTRFSVEQILQSASYVHNDEPFDHGEVAPPDWHKFTEIVKRGNEFRVHGSYFGQSTQEFAVQLFAYLHLSDHWHNWTREENLQDKHLQTLFTKLYQSRGDYAKSPIKYGVVLSSFNPVKVQEPSLLGILTGKLHGNITHQLMDDKTVVYK